MNVILRQAVSYVDIRPKRVELSSRHSRRTSRKTIRSAGTYALCTIRGCLKKEQPAAKQLLRSPKKADTVQRVTA